MKGAMLGAAFWHVLPKMSGFVHVDSPMDLDWRPPPKLVNLQEKVDRGTLDLELSLDSYSGAPRGPRASPGPLLGLQSKVTNFMIQGSTVLLQVKLPARSAMTAQSIRFLLHSDLSSVRHYFRSQYFRWNPPCDASTARGPRGIAKHGITQCVCLRVLHDICAAL